jgi:hypothetical protein
MHSVGRARTAFYVVRENSAKFVLPAGNVKFNTQDEEWISMCITLPVYFSIRVAQQKCTLLIIIGTNLKNAICCIGYDVATFSTFLPTELAI